jgi:hypothetical protein
MNSSLINSGVGLDLDYSDQAVFSRESFDYRSELPLTAGLIGVDHQHDVSYSEILLFSLPLLPPNERWKITFGPEVPKELSCALHVSKTLPGQGVREISWR